MFSMKIDPVKPHFVARFRHYAPVLAAGLLSINLAQADIITMKSGERYQGPLVTEDATTVTIEYNLTPKIKDKKTLNKADIKEHIRQSAALIAFEERGLAKILPTPDLLSAAEYESIIQDRLRAFLGQFPGTPEAAEVEKIIATLGEEKAKVLSGEVKMEGRWVDADTARRDSYNIDAFRARQAMKKAAAENVDSRYLEAMRHFETLRTQYPASLQYVSAIPEALEILDAYEKLINTLIAEQPIISKRREDGLKLLSPNEMQVAKSAVDQEKATFKAQIEAQVKNKTKWRDYYKYDLKSLQDVATTIIKERAELKAINLAALQAENEILTATIRFLADGNATEAQNSLGRINKGSVVNRLALSNIERQVRTAITEEQKKQRAKTSGAIAAPAEGSKEEMEKTESGEAGNPIAEAAKKRQEELEKKKAAAEKMAAEKKEAEASAEKAPAPEPEPEGFMAKINDYIPYIGAGLLVVLLLVMFLGKKKKE